MRVLYKKDYFKTDEDLVVQHLISCSSPRHMHEFFEFAVITKGEAEHIVDGKSYRTRPGSVVFINFGQSHEIKTDGCEYYNILISPGYIGSELYRETEAVKDLFSFVYERGDGDQCVNFSGADVTKITTLISELYREVTEKKEMYREASGNLLHLILIMLLREVKTDRRGNTSEKMNEIIAWLKEHYTENPTLSEVCKKFYYNDSYFSRMFKRFTGEGFNAYVNSLKVSEAVELLESTDLSAEEIAGRVGYADVKTFYARFKKTTGTTPGAFRRKR